jgi:hypothetical protein
MRAALISFFLLAACSPSEPPLLIDDSNQPATLAGRQAPLPVETVRSAARAEAARLHPRECGTVTIPDDAFVPVEVTGGGDPEYAVFFGHARCDAQGSLTFFSGTGGAQIEIWSSSGDAPRLLLRHSMHGFKPTPAGLISVQHGAYCPGGAGPGMCVVAYHWRGPEDGFEVRSRRLYDDQHRGAVPAVDYDWNYPLPG